MAQGMMEAVTYRDVNDVSFRGRSLSSILDDHQRYLQTRQRHLRAQLDHADLKGVRLKDVNLSEASLDGADLEMAVLIGGRFDRASLRQARLRNAYLV
jgi:uncharacterized protein YjbI with pentapeptide repeats